MLVTRSGGDRVRWMNSMQSAIPFRKGGSEAKIFMEKQQTNGRLGSEGDQHASFVWGVGFGERHPAGVKRAWRSTLRNRSASGESRKAGRNLTEAARYIRTAGGATVSTHGGVTAPESPAGNGVQRTTGSPVRKGGHFRMGPWSSGHEGRTDPLTNVALTRRRSWVRIPAGPPSFGSTEEMVERKQTYAERLLGDAEDRGCVGSYTESALKTIKCNIETRKHF